MIKHTAQDWVDYAESLAFVGNSLLAPMSQTGAVGLDPGFWADFPDFDDENVRKALHACEVYARQARSFAASGGDAVQRASVEYTRLFIGPPSPAAAPWETLQKTGDDAVGFGEATFDMQRLLREEGLGIANQNNQYADHIGIELLYASVLSNRMAEALTREDMRGVDSADPKMSTPRNSFDATAVEEVDHIAGKLAGFIKQHPLDWIGNLLVATERAEPDGYIFNLLVLSKALLEMLVQDIDFTVSTSPAQSS